MWKRNGAVSLLLLFQSIEPEGVLRSGSWQDFWEKKSLSP